MRIIGIDQSLVATGWALVDFKSVKKFKLKDYGLIQPGKLRGDERLIYIEDRVVELIKIFKPGIMAIEGYAFARGFIGKDGKVVQRSSSLFQLGELGWAIRRLFYIDEIEYVVINPATLKKQFAGHGRATKEMMVKRAQEMSGAKFGRITSSLRHNAAEAFAICWVGFKTLRERKGPRK